MAVRQGDVRLAGRLRHHPAIGQAIKSGLAAGVAWQIGSLLPAPMSDRAYYAALGAISVMYMTIADAAVEAVRVVAAIVLGVAVAGLIWWIWAPNVVTVGVVVCVSMFLAALPVLGAQAMWLPLAALFVLTASSGSPESFSADYVVQVCIGAGVGVLVNSLVFPPLAMHSVHHEMSRMRGLLVSQLRSVALGLRSGQAVALDRWTSQLRGLSPARERLRLTTARTHRARRANLRAARWQQTLDELMRLSKGMERLAWLIEDVSISLYEFQRIGSPAVDPRLAELMASTVAALAEVIERSDSLVPYVPDDQRHQVDDELDRLISYAEHESDLPRDDRLLAIGTAIKLQGCLRTFRTVHRE